MDTKTTPTATIIILLMVAFFTVFLAVKQYLVLRDQVYQEAFYGID